MSLIFSATFHRISAVCDNPAAASSLYVHIPFCSSKCLYCDFFSRVVSREQRDEYVGLLGRHLELLHLSGDLTQPLETVFFGGGTPSLLRPEQVASLLERLNTMVGLAENAEISLEANPGKVDLQRLRGYRQAGVNRLSLGVQTLQDDALRQLGRGHTRCQAEEFFDRGRQAGFDNLGCDLMFGLPGQTPDLLLQDLEGLLRLQPDHLSCYGLTVEPGTPFAGQQRRGQLDLPGEELFRTFYLMIHEELTGAGFEHYEISNYARPGRLCRHNMTYWQRRGCHGVGAGAHAFCASGYGRRRWIPADLRRYRRFLQQGRDPAARLESFDRLGAMAETLYLGLRCRQGVCENGFRERFDVTVAEAFPEALKHCGARLRKQQGCWRFDLEGWLLYDHFIVNFL